MNHGLKVTKAGMCINPKFVFYLEDCLRYKLVKNKEKKEKAYASAVLLPKH